MSVERVVVVASGSLNADRVIESSSPNAANVIQVNALDGDTDIARRVALVTSGIAQLVSFISDPDVINPWQSDAFFWLAFPQFGGAQQDAFQPDAFQG